MTQLERNFSHNQHVHIIAPAVHRFAAQAKVEQSPLVAFNISDFCHRVTQIVSKGLHVLHDLSYAAGKGTLKGAKIVLSPEHWQEMAMGTLHLGLQFLDAVGNEDARQNAVLVAAYSQNYDAIPKLAQDHYLHTQAQRDAINRSVLQTYDKIKAAPWQKLVEKGFELGTTMILDVVALNAASGLLLLQS